MLKNLLKLAIALLFFLSFNVESGGNLKGEGLHTFYFYSKSSQATIKTTTEDEAKNLIYFKKSLKGESVTFNNKESAMLLLSNLSATEVFIENGEDFYCKYYYSKDISDYIILKGQRVNLHLSERDGCFTVGSPIIFGSF